MNPPKILITNDDGIYSPGIHALWEAMCEVGDPIAVAPKTEQSAKGHAITITKPLRVKAITRDNGFIGWSVNGTPSDCTKLAIKSLLNEKPDLIISGINQGANLGSNIIYSGTISAAAEGAILGIPSIAISLASYNTHDYKLSKSVAIEIATHVLNYDLPNGTLLNVNVPYCDQKDIKGWRVTRQGNQYFSDQYEEKKDPRKQKYYWIYGRIIDEDESLDYDGKAISENYISITPIHFRLTNESYINKLNRQLFEK